ncbi:MAG: glycosyltransferase [Chloroflexi bacterium]|nr:glycosyltransferase [Chloroflexota bacterium]
MRLLLVTPKVDPRDDLFGHVQTWAEALARRVERLYIVALWDSQPDLPQNVRFAALGKAGSQGGGGTAVERVVWLARLQRIVARLGLRGEIDAVLAHMGPVFAVAAAPVARLAGVPTFLWYAHGHVSPMLRLAHILVAGVGTSTPEGFRIPSQKVTLTGQGLDLGRFRPPAVPPDPHTLLTVGRFSPIKDHATLLEAVGRLEPAVRAGLSVEVVGGVHSDAEAAHLAELRQRAERLGLNGSVHFVPGLPHAEIVSAYQRASLFATASRTGSLDKAALEAAACGAVPLVCNPAFRALFGERWPELSFVPGDAAGLAERLSGWLGRSIQARQQAALAIRGAIERSHSVDHWADAVVDTIARRTRCR